MPLAPIPVEAGGEGGGCGRPVTEATGTDVGVRNFCFSPTIIRVWPGQSVVWSNKDTFEHDVVGANFSWGAQQTLPAGATVTYKFSSPGVYPYVCTFHPGMVGAVVVGGSGLEGIRKLDPQSVEAVLSNLPTQQATRPVIASASGGQPHQASSSVWNAVAITLIALFVTIAVAAAVVTARQYRGTAQSQGRREVAFIIPDESVRPTRRATRVVESNGQASQGADMAKDSLRERLREPVYARAYREYLDSLVRRAQQQKPRTVVRGKVSLPPLPARG